MKISSDVFKYRPDIDGLRAVAVLAVIGFHVFPIYIKGGFIGVDIFFVISGFLITAIILTDLESNNFIFRHFYWRRIRRIFPSLTLVLLFSLVIGWYVLMADEYLQLGLHVFGGSTFISNFILWKESGYFDAAAEIKPLLHLWSLGIEEQFYVLWPLMLVLIYRTKLDIFLLLLAISVASFLFSTHEVATNSVEAFYSPLSRFWELLAGCMLAVFNFYYITNLKIIKNLQRVNNLASLFGFFLILFAIFYINKYFPFPGCWALIPITGAFLIIAAGPEALVNRIFLSNKLLVSIGLISYPLYLWHWPLLTFAQIINGGQLTFKYKLLVIFISFLLAWLTYTYIEKPLKLIKIYGTKALIVLPIPLLGFLGILIFQLNGVQFRAIAERTASFSVARSDWNYTPTRLESGKIVGLHILEGQDKNNFVLFAGDSLMGQYYPRLKELYADKNLPNLSSVFASRNHCHPSPNYDFISAPENINCKNYYLAILKLAQEKQYSKIVFAGAWPSLYMNGALTPEANELIKDIKNLISLGKKVYIISTPPRNPKFDPTAIARGLIFPSAIFSDILIKKSEIQDINSLNEMKLITRESGAILINPYDYFCDDKNCPYFLNNIPLYTDHTHMTASYSRRAAVFIDEIVSEK